MFGYHGSFLRPWLTVDMISLAFNVAVRLMAMQSITKTQETMSHIETQPTQIEADDATAEFRQGLGKQLLVGAHAMVQYDRLVNSPSFRLLDILPLFDFLWQGFGIGLLFDTPGEFCEARSLITWARIRGILFLVGMVPALISLGLSLGKAFTMGNDNFCIGVLKAAHQADEKMFPNGPPVFSVLVRAFVVRNTTDEAAQELKIIDFERQIAEAGRNQVKADLEAAEAKRADVQGRLKEHSEQKEDSRREEEFIRRYREITGRAEPTPPARA